MSTEVFKYVIGYEGLYSVSNKGRVKSFKRKNIIILAEVIDSAGYVVAGLSKNGKVINRKVHQLVCESFLGYRSDGTQRKVVNHINFNKTDNRVENLEIVSNRENTNQKHMKSISKYIGVHWSKYRSRWIARIKIHGRKVYLGCSKIEREAALIYAEAIKGWEGISLFIDKS